MKIIIIDNDKLIKENISSNYIYKKIIINKDSVSLLDDYFFIDKTKPTISPLPIWNERSSTEVNVPP